MEADQGRRQAPVSVIGPGVNRTRRSRVHRGQARRPSQATDDPVGHAGEPPLATGGLVGRVLGRQPLPAVWEAMKRFTAERNATTPDEIWFVEHPAVFTLGINGDAAHVLDPGDIPVLALDRGGQVTYHGPGQLVTYTLLDLARRKLGIRELVEALELAVIDMAAAFGLRAYARRDAPGVYVDGGKLAALGLRVSRRCSYHGIAVNVDMDLEPFGRINPCGFEKLPVTQLSELCGVRRLARVREALERRLYARLRGGGEDRLGNRRSAAAPDPSAASGRDRAAASGRSRNRRSTAAAPSRTVASDSDRTAAAGQGRTAASGRSCRLGRAQ